MNTEQPKQPSWALRIAALHQFCEREGHTRVPPKHTERWGTKEIGLGAWVRSTRRRYHKGTLGQEILNELASFPDWSWGPFKPGPTPNLGRDLEIKRMRDEGMSLQQIGTKYGLSRQRIHQIVGRRIKNG